MAHTTNNAETEQPSSWRKVIAIAMLASVIVSIVILAFTWPTKAMETKNLPVSIAGPEAAVSQFEQGLKDRGIETFEFKQASSREDAERQIKERETYGAIVFTEGAAPEVMTAPAANASANQMLTGVAQQMNAQVQQQATAAKTQALQQAAQAGGQQGAIATQQLEQLKTEQEKLQQAQVKTTAVVPLGDGDPNGMGLAVAAFPLVMGGIIGGVLSISLVKGNRATLRDCRTLRDSWRTLHDPYSRNLVRVCSRRFRGTVGDLRHDCFRDGLLHDRNVRVVCRRRRYRSWRRALHVHRQPALRGKHAVAVYPRTLGCPRAADGAGCIQHAAAEYRLLPGCLKLPAMGCAVGLGRVWPSRRGNRLGVEGTPSNSHERRG